MPIRPPQHRIDATPKLIPRASAAWDHDRIAREKKELGDNADQHPVEQYFAGSTRYDLDASIKTEAGVCTMHDYLTGEPDVVFVLRRPKVRQMGTLYPLCQRDVARDGQISMATYFDVAAIGLAGIEGADGWEYEQTPAGFATEETLQQIYDWDGDGSLGALTQLGGAILELGAPLGRAEKKL